MSTDDIIYVINGALSALGAAIIIGLWKELMKIFKDRIRMEPIKKNFGRIKYFLPSISSCFILTFEVWLISQYTIVDIIFITLAIFLLVFSVFLIILMYSLEKNTNYFIGRTLSLHKKLNETKKNCQDLTRDIGSVAISILQDLPPDLKTKWGDTLRRIGQMEGGDEKEMNKDTSN